MIENKKARLNVPAFRQAQGKPDRANPCTDYTSKALTTQSLVCALLHPGADQAVTLDYLAAALQMEKRSVRRLIQRERLRGVPILSTSASAGYYLPATPADVAAFRRSMQSRAREITRVIRALKGAE